MVSQLFFSGGGGGSMRFDEKGGLIMVICIGGPGLLQYSQ